jgi:ferrochelatase
MSGGEWLGPTVEDTIVKLREAGHSAVFVQPIGFVCDHVEILFDIDILFRDFAATRGMKLYRAESLNDSPTFAKAVAKIVRGRLAAC